MDSGALSEKGSDSVSPYSWAGCRGRLPRSFVSHMFSRLDGWVETPEANFDFKPGYQSLYAIACKMARALRWTPSIVYDQLVKSPSPITDYLTRCVSQIMAPLFAL